MEPCPLKVLESSGGRQTCYSASELQGCSKALKVMLRPLRLRDRLESLPARPFDSTVYCKPCPSLTNIAPGLDQMCA